MYYTYNIQRLVFSRFIALFRKIKVLVINKRQSIIHIKPLRRTSRSAFAISNYANLEWTAVL